MSDEEFQKYLIDNNLKIKCELCQDICHHYPIYLNLDKLDNNDIYSNYLKAFYYINDIKPRFLKKYYIKNIKKYYLFHIYNQNKIINYINSNMKSRLMIYYLKKNKKHKAKYYSLKYNFELLYFNHHHEYSYQLFQHKKFDINLEKKFYDLNNLNKMILIEYNLKSSLLYFIIKK